MPAWRFKLDDFVFFPHAGQGRFITGLVVGLPRLFDRRIRGDFIRANSYLVQCMDNKLRAVDAGILQESSLNIGSDRQKTSWSECVWTPKNIA